MLLTEKITRAEDVPLGSVEVQFSTPGGVRVDIPWWLRREYLRIAQKVYPEGTELLQASNRRLPQLAVHVSREDPTLVAYTPDRASGEADRQVRTSLGKFLVKHYPYLDDNTIRNLQEEHLAELDSTFEELFGQDIVKAYRELGTRGACMSYVEDKYTAGNPTQAYDAPGISMAVLRDKEGNITARCMLYKHSETDKRWIRCYLDQKLVKRLERSGYKKGTWVGAKFKTIKLEDSGSLNWYVVPYLDGGGQAGSGSHSRVAVIDGELTCVSLDVANKIHARFGADSCVSATVTSGSLLIKPIDTITEAEICFLTGRTISWLTDVTESYFDGTEIRKVLAYAVFDMQLISVTPVLSAYAARSLATFTARGRTVLDTPENRACYNFIKLDSFIYPEDKEWHANTSYTPAYTKTARGTYIKMAESVLVYTGSVWEAEHVSVIDKTYTKLHPRNGIKCYATAGTPVFRTFKGSKVVANGYSIQKLHDGTWDFDRNVASKRVFHQTLCYRKAEPVPDTRVGSDMWYELLEKEYEGVTPEAALIHYVSMYGGRYHYLENTAFYNHYNQDIRIENIKTSVDIMRDAGVVAVVRWAEYRIAEANAIDYSLGPMPTPDYTKPFPTIEQNKLARLEKERLAKEAKLAALAEERRVASSLATLVNISSFVLAA